MALPSLDRRRTFAVLCRLTCPRVVVRCYWCCAVHPVTVRSDYCRHRIIRCVRWSIPVVITINIVEINIATNMTSPATIYVIENEPIGYNFYNISYSDLNPSDNSA